MNRARDTLNTATGDDERDPDYCWTHKQAEPTPPAPEDEKK